MQQSNIVHSKGMHGTLPGRVFPSISNTGRHFDYVKGQMDDVNSVCVAMQKQASPAGKRPLLFCCNSPHLQAATVFALRREFIFASSLSSIVKWPL
jgi:hypothetical protein